MKIAVSFLKSKYSIKKTIRELEQTTCDYIHVDVMDGIFVKQNTKDLTLYLKNTAKKLDVHLMVANPLEYIEKYKNLNVEYITIHLELAEKIDSLIEYLKNLNIKVGLAINPDTKIEKIKPYLNKIDQVLIMSVYPGKGGQEFLDSSLEKFRKLKEVREANNYKYIINIDGGINDNVIKKLEDIDMIVSGSYICMSDNYQKQINKLKKLP